MKTQHVTTINLRQKKYPIDKLTLSKVTKKQEGHNIIEGESMCFPYTEKKMRSIATVVYLYRKKQQYFYYETRTEGDKEVIRIWRVPEPLTKSPKSKNQ